MSPASRPWSGRSRISTTVSSDLKVASLPLSGGEDVDHTPLILDFVENAVVTDAYPPERLGSDEHPAPWWAWGPGERLDTAQDPARDTWRQSLQFPSRRASEEDAVSSHGPVAVVGDGDGL
jgi:hypothetical protein